MPLRVGCGLPGDPLHRRMSQYHGQYVTSLGLNLNLKIKMTDGFIISIFHDCECECVGEREAE